MPIYVLGVLNKVEVIFLDDLKKIKYFVKLIILKKHWLFTEKYISNRYLHINIFLDTIFKNN